MKRSKLILLAAAVLFAWSGSSFSQAWQFVGFLAVPGASPSLSVADANTIWCAGGAAGAPKVFRSTNGGVNFTDVSGNISGTAELYCSWGVDANTCYAGDGGANGGAGGNAKVWKTTNGGTTWTTILTTGGTGGFINGIAFSRSNPLIGIIESDPPSGLGGVYWVQKTTDGGVTWTLQSPPGIPNNASAQSTVRCVDINHYGFGTSAAAAPCRVVYTTNGGTTWTNVIISSSGTFTSAFAMASDWVNGVAAGSTTLPLIGRTTNGCTSFANVNGVASMTGTATATWVPGTQRVYMASGVGASGCVEQSTDGGATWSVMNTSAITGINDIDCVISGNLVTAYAVATDGSIIKLQTDITGIDPNNNTTPTTYKLEQNYPNPFNPTTNIRYSLPKASDVTVKLYDILGHEVMTVVNAYQNAGNYTQTVNASSLASGVYFYTIKAGDFSQTLKMSLVK